MGDQEKKIKYFVDVPPPNPLNNKDWTCVANFDSEEEAIVFAQKYYGADKNGKVDLISRIEVG